MIFGWSFGACVWKHSMKMWPIAVEWRLIKMHRRVREMPASGWPLVWQSIVDQMHPVWPDSLVGNYLFQQTHYNGHNSQCKIVQYTLFMTIAYSASACLNGATQWATARALASILNGKNNAEEIKKALKYAGEVNQLLSWFHFLVPGILTI